MIQRRFLGSVRILCGRAVSRSARSLQSKYQTMENHTHYLCSRMWRADSTVCSGSVIAGWPWPNLEQRVTITAPNMTIRRRRSALSTDAEAKCRSEKQTSELQTLMRNSYAGLCLKK